MSLWRRLLIILSILVTSCVPPKPPGPPIRPQSPSPEAYAQDCGVLYQDELGRAPDPSGLAACEARLAARTPLGAVIEDQEAFRAYLRTTDEYAARQEALKAAAVVVLPRLVIRGNFLQLDTGQRFTVIEASGFTLYQQFLDGGAAAIEPVLQQLEDVGFNAVRVFGMYNNPPQPRPNDPGYGGIGRFIPADYGDRYWSGLAPFYQLLARHHIYGEFVVFADTTVILPTKAAQLQHWETLLQAFAGHAMSPPSNLLIEAVNEEDQTINRVAAVGELSRPARPFIASHGSNGSQAQPVQPYWDLVTFHTNDSSEEARKISHNCWEIWSGPCLTNEITRDGKGAWLNFPGDVARAAALLPAGACYHSTVGKQGKLLAEPQLSHARAWVAGAKSMPLACQDGAYRHGQNEIDEETNGGFLRVYQRGNDPACRVRIRRD